MKRSGRVLERYTHHAWYTVPSENLDIFEPVWRVINPGALLGRFWPSLFFCFRSDLPLQFLQQEQEGPRSAGARRDPAGTGTGVPVQHAVRRMGHNLAPVIFSVAFGLFELYIFGNREKGLLIPIGILGGLSFLFFFTFSLSRLLRFDTGPYAIPVLFIGVGLILVSGGRKNRV